MVVKLEELHNFPKQQMTTGGGSKTWKQSGLQRRCVNMTTDFRGNNTSNRQTEHVANCSCLPLLRYKHPQHVEKIFGLDLVAQPGAGLNVTEICESGVHLQALNRYLIVSRTLLEALRMLISSLRSYRTRAFVLDSGPSLCSASLAALWTVDVTLRELLSSP